MATEAIYEVGIEKFGVGAGGVSLLDVEGYDPLKGTITVKNNKLDQYTYVNVGFLLGFYDETNKTFTFIKFTENNVDYWWGTYCAVSLPAKGNTKDGETYTYALNPTSSTTYDAFVFVGEGIAMNSYNVDWGSGGRILGIKKAEISSLTLYDTVVYTDAVTISPYRPPAEVTNFTLEKA